jgi:hypothetical protein
MNNTEAVALAKAAKEKIYDARWLRADQDIHRVSRFLNDMCTDVPALAGHVLRLAEENAALKARLLTAAGDDLCRLTQEEIKAMSLGTVKIPPKEEFLASCERFHAQVANESGVMSNCLTLAQLVAENERLEQQLGPAIAAIREQIAKCKDCSGKGHYEWTVRLPAGTQQTRTLICPHCKSLREAIGEG